jgi:PAS domain S-box-containing protein
MLHVRQQASLHIGLRQWLDCIRFIVRTIVTERGWGEQFMTPKDQTKSQSTELRGRAEKRVKRNTESAVSRASGDTGRLIHELKVHQVELELQNEELRQTRAKLEENYNELYDFAPVGYFTLGRDGDIEKTNLTGAGMLGQPRAQLLGHRLETFISPESLHLFNGFLRRVMQRNEKESCVVTLTKGGITPVAVYIEATREGSDSNFRAVAVDITSAEPANRQLRESEERLKVLRAPPDTGVWEWERGSDDIYWSPDSFDIFGIDRFCTSVHTLAQLLHPEDAACVARVVSQTLDNGKVHTVDFRIVRPNGEVTWISAMGEANKYDKDGKALRLVGTVVDVTKRKQANNNASPGPESCMI